jgi:hypothetical protein
MFASDLPHVNWDLAVRVQTPIVLGCLEWVLITPHIRENPYYVPRSPTYWIFNEINCVARHVSLFGPVREDDSKNLIAHSRFASFVKLICEARW